MKRIQVFLAIGVAALFLASLTGCSSSGETGSSSSSNMARSTESIKLPTEPPGIRGAITKADSTAGSSNILVEEDPADASGSNKASVRLNDDTKIYRRSGGSLEKSSASALTVGNQVSVWFEGPVAESYPVQGSAAVVLLEE